MGGATNRRSGHNLEREVAADMRELTGQEYGTTRAIAPHLDGEGVDVFAFDGGFAIQAKNGLRPNHVSALMEAVGGAAVIKRQFGRDVIPVAVCHRKQSKGQSSIRTVTMLYSTFKELVRERSDVKE